ncbi:MAG: type I-E CRISPR-associated protein Cse2/CasB [Gemmatimonadaceae bacterium]
MSNPLTGPPTRAPSPARSSRGERALAWWQRLRDPKRGDPAALAQLRRARSTPELLGIRAAVSLARRLGAASGEASDWHTRAALDLARVLAHVKEHDRTQHPMRAAGWKRFAGDRKESDAGEDRPLLAEGRFKRLLQTGDGEEKVTAFVRLIALLGGRVKVDALAEDFLLWNHPEWGDRVRERWAFLFYAASDAAPVAPPTTVPDTDTDTEDDEV